MTYIAIETLCQVIGVKVGVKAKVGIRIRVRESRGLRLDNTGAWVMEVFRS